MLKPVPFANAAAATSAMFVIVLLLLRLVAPPLFTWIFNSQMLGANIASLLPRDFVSFLVGGVGTVTITWLFGFVLTVLYNRWSR
ncbi:MAG TPA: DUF5676 family membrane protein [Candidatus Acidoferrales bacterium]|jgi:hypothetical protein|nr:DUF5676 family membrane protein [Candidatus Acidoferrales bacterium]